MFRYSNFTLNYYFKN